jgi:predicted transcriptional regulator YheO
MESKERGQKKNPNIKLTTKDREILETIKPIVDGIAGIVGTNCEVLLHSLDDISHSVIHIKNGNITGRSIGSPLTDLGIQVLNESYSKDQDVIGNYISKTKDGKTLKSVTVMIRNGLKKPIGMLCININLNASLLSVLEDNLKDLSSNYTKYHETFSTSIEELLSVSYKEASLLIEEMQTVNPKKRGEQIVQELYRKGVFSIRGAIDYIADRMEVSRYTIYNYIREAKRKTKH